MSDSVAVSESRTSQRSVSSAATSRRVEQERFQSSPGSRRQSIDAVASPGMTLTLWLPYRPVTEIVVAQAALRSGSSTRTLRSDGSWMAATGSASARREFALGAGGQLAKVRVHRRDQPDRWLVGEDLRHGPHEPGHRAVRRRNRRVAGLAGRHDPEPERRLLRHIDVPGHRAPVFDRDRVAFGQAVLGVAQVGSVFLDHLGNAVLLALLLVGCAEEDHVAIERNPGAFEQQHRHELADRRALHVGGSASPDVAVPDVPGERGHGPALRVGGYDVEVIEEQDGSREAAARQPGQDVGPLLAEVVDPVLDALPVENLLEKLGGQPLAARRIRRVHAQVGLQQPDRFAPRRLEVRGLGGRARAGPAAQEHAESEYSGDSHARILSSPHRPGAPGIETEPVTERRRVFFAALLVWPRRVHHRHRVRPRSRADDRKVGHGNDGPRVYLPVRREGGDLRVRGCRPTEVLPARRPGCSPPLRRPEGAHRGRARGRHDPGQVDRSGRLTAPGARRYRAAESSAGCHHFRIRFT